MRILYDTDIFSELFHEYQIDSRLRGCVVMRTAQRKKDLRQIFLKYRDTLNVRVHKNVVFFNSSGSMIHLCCLAQRPKIMYDEIMIDGLIDDQSTIAVLAQLERPKVVQDFGEIESSEEILAYIRGEYGN